MALSQDENLADAKPSRPLITESTEPNSNAADQLEGLVSLLVDLQILDSPSPIKAGDPSPSSDPSTLQEQLAEPPSAPSSQPALAEAIAPSADISAPNDLVPEVLTPEVLSREEVTGVDHLVSDSSDSNASPLETALAVSLPEVNSEDLDRLVTELHQLLGRSANLEEIETSLSNSEQPEVDAGPLAIQFSEPLAVETASAITSDWERLQSLLVGPELSDVQGLVDQINQKLVQLEYQISDPTEWMKRLLPLIAQLLSLKIKESKEEVVQAIAPIIDEMIRNKAQQDKVAISQALSTIIPAAIAQRIKDSPEEIANAIAPEMATAIRQQIHLQREAIANALAPEMGAAIREQVRLEGDAMVDALYPVIGNTIAKYMVEAVRSINEKVENTLSPEGIHRKIRARVQGISEAELILQESIPFVVQAVFLIHKSSGLVIAEAQQSGNQKLESEMVAGMLTAIRSFVHEWIAQAGDASELNQIEYGGSYIILEVAGYCYLAVVVQGNPPKPFLLNMRQTLSTLVQDYNKVIQEFDGDPATVPDPIPALLISLLQSFSPQPRTKPSNILLIISLLLLGAIGLPWGLYQYRQTINHRIETQVASALASTPELAVYRLNAEVNRGTLQLTGQLPNEYLRQRAAQIAATAAPKQQVDNQILAIEVPPDPVLTTAEVQRVTTLLNQMRGITLTTDYAAGKVNIRGTVAQSGDAELITQAFEQIPGIKLVSNTVQIEPLAIPARIYFAPGSASLTPADIPGKIIPVKTFLQQYPHIHLQIRGHSDQSGTPEYNRQLALQRSQAVRDALVSQGVDSQRLQVMNGPTSATDIHSEQPLWLSRYVAFEAFTPTIRNP